MRIRSDTTAQKREEEKMMKATVMALLLALFSAAMIQAQPVMIGPSSDCAAIRDAMEKYALSANTNNIDLRLSLWASDGIQTRNDTTVLDRATIEQRVRANMTSTNSEFTIKIEEVVVSGDLGFARGQYTNKSTPKAGGASSFVDGRYTSIFKRQPDGSWKLYRDMMVIK